MSSLNNSSANSSLQKGMSLHSFPDLSPAKNVELHAWAATLLVLCFIGSVNNVAVLIATWPKKSHKAGLNILIFHFVTANLLMCLINLPISVFLVMAKQHGSALPEKICDFTITPLFIVTAVVEWCDVALAVNRVIALYFPLKYNAWTRPAVNFGIIAAIWVVSVFTVLPFPLRYAGNKTVLSPLGSCSLSMDGRLGKFIAVVLGYITYVFTGFAALLLIGKSMHMTRKRRRAVQQQLQTDRFRETKRLTRSTKVLLLTILWSAFWALLGYVAVSRFAYLYATNPISMLWLKTFQACQFGFPPVRISSWRQTQNVDTQR